MQARSAVQCRSARLSEAVSPAKSAWIAIGLIVVKSVAKSLLILIRSGDICRSVCFILIRMTYQARAKLLCSASLVIERVKRSFPFTLSCHAIASRLAVASCEGWLASAEALYERSIKREAKLAVPHGFFGHRKR